MNRFNRLSDDEITNISLFLDPKSLNCFGLTSTSIYVCCQKDEIWFNVLQYQMFPSYIPLSGNREAKNRFNIHHDNSNERERETLKKSSRYKIRNFKNKLFNMSSLGKLKTFKSRYLHRSVIASNGTNFIFGGVTTSDNTESGNFSDVWKLDFEEGSKGIRLSKVKIIQTKGDFKCIYASMCMHVLKTSFYHLKLGQQCCDTNGQYHESWN
jgi:hypothetical protein